jgi:hypothetical protein
MMGLPYRHHRNTWLEESQRRSCACSKAAINFSGRIAPRSPRSSGFLQNEESCAGDAGACPRTDSARAAAYDPSPPFVTVCWGSDECVLRADSYRSIGTTNETVESDCGRWRNAPDAPSAVIVWRGGEPNKPTRSCPSADGPGVCCGQFSGSSQRALVNSWLGTRSARCPRAQVVRCFHAGSP